MNKKQVLQEFRMFWADLVAVDKNMKGDTIAKREAFNNYVDLLNKERRVTDKQAYTWSNPF